ncbi:TonB-dependent receptor [Haliea sp. E1-2-M8]|uniref:TonB-dependent receptor plug domain-containing protein n=1 Tax=Haliea sp. E1-2-M8 TaxID=3064706 RepID=UPI002725D37F|nr:TonB-dependent receptor [Haliea sp. E1-2-M8]MDO8863158.1 TonB-dependent receptor [Haliea sp. E1-2-M8]
MKPHALAGAVALLTTLPAWGNNTATYPLEEIVISSSRIAMPLREVGTSISVIDAADIRARGFTSLQDILRSQPSVAVSNNGGPGKISSLRIRGEEAYRTRILIDGIDISDTSAPQVGPRVEQLLSSGVQRVEILRGPQGLMYGADAGGVINISTRTPGDGFGGDVSAETGRYGSQHYAANIGAGSDTLDGNLSLADYRSDGFNSRTNDIDPADDDGYKNTTVHARGGWNISEQLRLELVGRDVDGDNQFDGCFTNDTFAPSNRCSDSFSQQSWRTAASFRGDQLQHELAYSHNRTERQLFTEGLPGFGTEGTLSRVSYLGSYSPAAALQLVYGVDHEEQTLDDGTFDTERDQTGAYLEYQGRLGDSLYFTAGGRYDDNENFGSHDSYRVSAAYLVPVGASELKFKGAWSTGFRAPSLYEIAYNRSFFASPPAVDVSLQEERSEGHEFGVAWFGPAGLVLEAIIFEQTVENEIFFDLEGYSGYLQGSGDSDSKGVELIAEVPLPMQLQLQGNYTYNDTETAAGGHRVYRPRHLANVGLQWQAPSSELALGLHLRASRDAREFDGSALDNYEVLDLNARYTLAAGLEVYGRIENLLDEDYEEIPSYRTSGRAAYAGLRFSF